MLSLALLSGASRCDNVGVIEDAGIPEPDPEPAAFVASDIGTACVYDPATGANPTNDCPTGLTCLISTIDGAYSPYPAGDPRNLSLAVFEDHFTYFRDDGLQEGYCTLIGSIAQPPACPQGTAPKALAPNLTVCVRTCNAPTDCGRSGYTCDARFLDVPQLQCVRQCTLDFPDCIRSGWFQRGENPPSPFLEVADINGSSYCDVQNTGRCAANPGGTQAPGLPCNDSRDCASSICIQGLLLNQPGGQGFCAASCKFNPQAAGMGCPYEGYVCQPGFTFGFGDPLDQNVNDNNGFMLISSSTGQFFEGGGVCLPSCAAGDELCNSFPGTGCGSANVNVFGAPWNGVEMCLLPSMRN